MQGGNYRTECEFVKKLVKEAYQLAQDTVAYVSMEKKAFDVVTSVDFAVEKFMIEKIREQYPQDRILSEETNSETAVEGRTWVIDPIDGTYNYAKGMPMFGVQCALYDGGRPVMGVIYLPEAEELFYGVEGGGAFLNGEPIHVDPVELEKCVVSFSDYTHTKENVILAQQKMIDRLCRKVGRIRMFGASCVDYAYLAAGRTNGLVTFSNVKWDIAPGLLLCREAGAVFLGESGEYTEDSGVVLGACHGELAKLLQDALK